MTLKQEHKTDEWQQTNFIQIIALITSSLGKRATVGYEDGTLKLWDLRQGIHTFHLSGNYRNFYQ